MPDTPIGHIYYDMYWDEKPGWKAIPPQSPEEDHPPLWDQNFVYVLLKYYNELENEEINPKVVWFEPNCQDQDCILTEVKNHYPY